MNEYELKEKEKLIREKYAELIGALDLYERKIKAKQVSGRISDQVDIDNQFEVVKICFNQLKNQLVLLKVKNTPLPLTKVDFDYIKKRLSETSLNLTLSPVA